MSQSKNSRDPQTTENGSKGKSAVTATTREIGQKMKVLIAREGETLRDGFQTIVRMVSPKRETPPAPRTLVGRKAPDFKAPTVFKTEIKEIQFSDYQGQYVVLFFYPLDFTFVCPTELHAFQEHLAEFKKRGVEVLACSVDSQFSHLNWLKTPKSQGGVQGVTYGLISDLGGHIAHQYGVLSDEGTAYRALFLIDQKGIVRHHVVNDMPLGRSVTETLRMVDALQHTEKHGEVCPADWRKGEKALQTNSDSVADYLTETSSH